MAVTIEAERDVEMLAVVGDEVGLRPLRALVGLDLDVEDAVLVPTRPQLHGAAGRLLVANLVIVSLDDPAVAALVGERQLIALLTDGQHVESRERRRWSLAS